MGKRVTRRWNLFAFRFSVFLVLGGMFFLGACAGCLFAIFTDGQGMRELEQYLRQYFEWLKNKEIQVSFWRILWFQGRYVLTAGVLGATSAGLIGLPLLLGIRGFLLSFSVASCYRMFGVAGLWNAGILFVIPAVCWLPGMLFLGERGVRNGLHMLNRDDTIRQTSHEYGGVLYAVTLLLVGVLLEYRIVPSVIELTIRMI